MGYSSCFFNEVGASRQFSFLLLFLASTSFCFSSLVFCNGVFELFFFEAKAFNCSIEEGLAMLRNLEKSRGVSRAVFLGKVIVWLSATMEALIQGEELREFEKSSRVGSRAFIAQTGSNIQGALAE
jgi:hypothetical protein